MRILVMEDDLSSQCLLRGYLEPYGRVDIARDGDDAIAAFTTAHADGQPYELVFLDILVPRKSGHDVLRRIRAIEASKGILGAAMAKVIMASSLSSKEHIFQAFKEQCEAYLVKPVDRKELIRTLKKLGIEEPT